MSVPQWFMKAISSLDPLLSVRRSVVTSHYVIERKAVILPSEVETLRRRRDRIYRWITFPNDNQKKQLHQNRMAWQSLQDEVASAECGKRIICRPRVLNQQVYNDLCASDMKRYGGAARYCTQLEQEEERREADLERMASNKRQAMNAEIYDMMHFLDRKKSDAMANGNQDMQYLLHGRHSKPGDAPVIQLTDF
jgi:hypothetical protein